MRIAAIALACLPLPAWSDVMTLPSQATAAVIYPEGGLVTHEVAVTVGRGTHELIFPDLPASASLEQIRVSSEALQIGSIRFRENFVPPRDDRKSEEVAAAEARIEQIEDQIQAVRDEATRLTLTKAAADAQITFLTGLGDSDALPSDPGALAQIGTMVNEQVLTARQAAFDADVQSRAVLKRLKPLQEELAKAQAALAALVPESEDRPLFSMEVTADSDVTAASVRISYFSRWMGWTPTYNLRLTDEDEPRLTIERGAEVGQETEENWEGIKLTLSTQRPSDQIDPSFLPEDLRRLIDPKEDLPKFRTRAAAPARLDAEADTFAGAVAEQAVILAEPQVQGLSVIYNFPNPVNIANGADSVRIPFDELEFDATLVARAVPMRDSTAYLVAQFVNDSDEPLLPSNQVQRFFDGGLVGVSSIASVAPGEEIELGFGPIEGLQLTRKVLGRAEGDRGIISRSNEQSENVRIELENLTNRKWQVELLDRVPYSEQEDLEITYKTNPAPDMRGVDDRRGILQWNIELEPGTTATVETEFQMTWPEGQIVR